MNRKGITPVVGAILLLSISVAATVSAFTFLNQIQGDLQETSEDRIQDEQDELARSINIEFVYNGTDGNTLMSVRNTGSVSLQPQDEDGKIWSLFIEGVPQDGDDWEIEEGIVIMDPQETITVDTGIDYPEEGETMNIQLTGTHISDTHVCVHSGSSSC